MNFRDQTFDRELINLDDNVFTGCTFNDCRILYKGGELGRIAVNTFNNCLWEFQGAAANTLGFLRQLYHGGGQQVVEQTITTIRAPIEPLSTE